MKKIFTILLFGLALLAWPVQAQEIDERFVFMDEEGMIIENGATVIRNVVEQYDEESEVIYSGISVMNLAGSADDYIKMHYTIERIDNGIYQICFPSTCNMKTEAGVYATDQGTLMSDVQDLNSEWFPVADGECIVTLTIEILSRQGFFPPIYVHEAYGPTITVRFVKSDNPDTPSPGDVNCDGEVNIADINAVIDSILSQSGNKAADVNNDGEINIADVNTVIAIILN